MRGKLLWIGLLFVTVAVNAATEVSPDSLALQQRSGLTAEGAPTTKSPYTFSDFFDALDLPCVIGVAINNNKLEKPGMITAFRLGWRQHKNYGWCSYITYDFHVHNYENVKLADSNVRTGEITYNEIGWCVGYRIPIVKNLKTFYQHPELKLLDFYVTLAPLVSLVNTKHVEPVQEGTQTVYSVIDDRTYAIPSGQLTAGLEIFATYNLSFYLETGLIQHFMSTNLEQAAIEAGSIKGPGRQGTIQVGLCMFFK